MALVLALAVYGMPVALAGAAMVYGAAFGLFPIGWIVIASLILYRVTLDTGEFGSLGVPVVTLPASPDCLWTPLAH